MMEISNKEERMARARNIILPAMLSIMAIGKWESSMAQEQNMTNQVIKYILVNTRKGSLMAKERHTILRLAIYAMKDNTRVGSLMAKEGHTTLRLATYAIKDNARKGSGMAKESYTILRLAT